MKVQTHPGGRRVSTRVARLVLDHSRPLHRRQWAAFFGVHLHTVESWRSQGMVLDVWSAPTAKLWATLKAEAVRSLWDSINVLEGNGC
jgi:hypothetical protein